LKAHKITEEQAKAAFENLKVVRKQQVEYFRQNRKKEITDDQKNQLEQQLKQNGGSI
jgi:hypothetical protein